MTDTQGQSGGDGTVQGGTPQQDQEIQKKIQQSDMHSVEENIDLNKVAASSGTESLPPKPNINIKSHSNTLPEIGDLTKYIEEKKREQLSKKTSSAKLVAADGTDLKTLPNLYAIVPHAKGDHKLVYFHDLAPENLIDDSKGRRKGEKYLKKGIVIYQVVIDFKEHPTLLSVDGEPLGVRLIASHQELEDQLHAIHSGRGGGGNFRPPVIIDADQATKVLEPTETKASQTPDEKKADESQPQTPENSQSSQPVGDEAISQESLKSSDEHEVSDEALPESQEEENTADQQVQVSEQIAPDSQLSEYSNVKNQSPSQEQQTQIQQEPSEQNSAQEDLSSQTIRQDPPEDKGSEHTDSGKNENHKNNQQEQADEQQTAPEIQPQDEQAEKTQNDEISGRTQDISEVAPPVQEKEVSEKEENTFHNTDEQGSETAGENQSETIDQSIVTAQEEKAPDLSTTQEKVVPQHPEEAFETQALPAQEDTVIEIQEQTDTPEGSKEVFPDKEKETPSEQQSEQQKDETVSAFEKTDIPLSQKNDINSKDSATSNVQAIENMTTDSKTQESIMQHADTKQQESLNNTIETALSPQEENISLATDTATQLYDQNETDTPLHEEGSSPSEDEQRDSGDYEESAELLNQEISDNMAGESPKENDISDIKDQKAVTEKSADDSNKDKTDTQIIEVTQAENTSPEKQEPVLQPGGVSPHTEGPKQKKQHTSQSEPVPEPSETTGLPEIIGPQKLASLVKERDTNDDASTTDTKQLDNTKEKKVSPSKRTTKSETEQPEKKKTYTPFTDAPKIKNKEKPNFSLDETDLMIGGKKFSSSTESDDTQDTSQKPQGKTSASSVIPDLLPGSRQTKQEIVSENQETPTEKQQQTDKKQEEPERIQEIQEKKSTTTVNLDTLDLSAVTAKNKAATKGTAPTKTSSSTTASVSQRKKTRPLAHNAEKEVNWTMIKNIGRIVGLLFLLGVIFLVRRMMFSNTGSTPPPVEKPGPENQTGQIIPPTTTGSTDGSVTPPEKDPDPIPEEPPLEGIFTLTELEKKLEAQELEARRVLNRAKLLGNKEAIKFSTAALLKAANTLEKVEEDPNITATEIQDDAERIDIYIKQATQIIE